MLAPDRQFVIAVTAQLATDGLEPDARDSALLVTAERLTDRMASLELMIAILWWGCSTTHAEAQPIKLEEGIHEWDLRND